ncbi:tyrosine-type recombinase/integrase [Vibrio rumoiensis]|uniref:Tyrosine-type recombinase/integrase n=1 Tax=Vibrio rumoiensis TaxID=76258 RepID=A0ABW7IS74_9VIBR
MLFHEWVNFFENRLTFPSKLHKDAVLTVLTRIDSQCPALLEEKRLKSDSAISSQSKPLSLAVQSRAELEVTTAILDGLFEEHVQRRNTLIAPVVRMPLPREKPVFNTNHLPVYFIEMLVEMLHEKLKEPVLMPESYLSNREIEAPSAYAGQLLLMVAYKTGLTKLNELYELVRVHHDTATSIADLAVVSVYLPTCHRRLYLHGTSLLAWKSLLPLCASVKTLTESKLNKWIKSVLNLWVVCACESRSEEIFAGDLAATESAVLKSIGLLHHSVGLQELWRYNHALDEVSFIRAMTGKVIKHHDYSDSQLIDNKCLNDPIEHQQDLGIGSVIKADNEKDNVKTTDPILVHEAQYHTQLLDILQRYRESDPKETRKSLAFSMAKKEMLALSERPLSWRSRLLVDWLISLFIHGSAWKAKLAISSLLTYHSRIKTFIKYAWSDLSILETDLETFTQACQIGIDHFEDINSQYTVARFLRYCLKYNGFPAIDLDIFDLVNASGKVRVNYLPPLMFDECCQSFLKGKGVLEKELIVFMALCYYAGLREDEALHLKCRDIYCDTGMLYITDEKKRKTSHAVRKIPLFLLPDDVLTLCLEHCEHVSQRHGEQAYLFQSWSEDGGRYVYQNLENQFIGHCRKHCQDPRIVTHIFRHCAANNWVILLSLVSFDLPMETVPYFLKHALFSEEKRKQVKAYFQSFNQPLSPYFPILDWVSDKIGHASPSTMFGVYLHLIDWVEWQISSAERPLSKSLLVQWVSDSNYGYELLKSLSSPCEDKPEKALLLSQEVAEFVQRKLPNKQRFKVLEPKGLDKQWNIESDLTFSDFVYQISWLQQGAHDKAVHKDLLDWCQQAPTIPESITIKVNQRAPWLRLCQQLDSISNRNGGRFKRLSAQSMKFLRYFIQDKAISKKSDLRSILVFYETLGISRCTVKIISDDLKSKEAQSWQELIESKGHSVHWVTADDKCLKALLRPYNYRWPLWDNFLGIAQHIQAYHSYVQFNARKASNGNGLINSMNLLSHKEAL